MPKIHPLAHVQSSKIGEETLIWQFSVVLENAVIGNYCNINCQVFIENDVIVGDNVTIKPGVQLWDGVTIEDDVFIGPNVTFTNDHVPRSKQYPESRPKTTIKKGASIGANATVLAGNIVGEYALIGAGSVVTQNVPAYHLYYGNPARHKGYVTKDGTLVDLQLKDQKGNHYVFLNEQLIIND